MKATFDREEDDIRGHHEPDDRPQSMIDLAEKIKLEEQLKLSELTRLCLELKQEREFRKELVEGLELMVTCLEHSVLKPYNHDEYHHAKSLIAKSKVTYHCQH